MLCSNEDCQWQGKLSLLEKHLKKDCEKEKNKKLKIQREINTKEVIEVLDGSLIENSVIEIPDEETESQLMLIYFMNKSIMEKILK